MRYLLDCNAVISLLKDADSFLGKRVRRCTPSDIGISSIVVFELFYGAFKSQRLTQNVAVIDGLNFETLDFDKEDARHAGEVRAVLAARGTPFRPYDVMIAGQARGRNITLVTHNISEFMRVPGLQVEDWNLPEEL